MKFYKDLLIEIGTEELPPRAIDAISLNLKQVLTEQLASKSLSFKNSTLFFTPRRIAILISGLLAEQPSRRIEKKGPLCEVALDDQGKPTAIGVGFAKSCQVPFEVLKQINTREGERLFCTIEEKGKLTSLLLPDIILTAFQKLRLEKRMRWGNLEDSFIRPVRWLLVLFGKEVVPVMVWGVSSSSCTYGHRFLNSRALKVTTPKRYEKILKTKGFVIPGFSERKAMIREDIQKQAEEISGKAVVEETLLAEVTNLVEWPSALRCHFDARFLQLPEEVLIAAIEHHQRCFPVRNKEGALHPSFITVSNGVNPNVDVIVAGNERVMRARLSDAEFFFKEDSKEPLAHRVNALKEVSLQEGLGSLYDKTFRVQKIGHWLTVHLKEDETHLTRAAYLAKADLITQMVNEFPELQGIMGGIYAKASGENEEAAQAIREHYFPRFANDRLPQSRLGCLLAIADRIDLLAGIFRIGKIPTAERDPFGLRRAALGILRIMIEAEVDIDLQALIFFAHSLYEMPKASKQGPEVLLQFMLDRLKFFYEEKGILPTVFNAVMAKGPTRPLDFQKRIEAVTAFIHLEEAEALIAANKRVSNILKKEARGFDVKEMVVKASLLKLPAEVNLAEKLKEARKETKQYYEKGAYTEALKVLANLRREVDRFFDTVLVMVEQTEVRNNRLALLSELRTAFTEVADISLL